jgi:uncharacterized protein YndB with AHSA1/START domain
VVGGAGERTKHVSARAVVRSESIILIQRPAEEVFGHIIDIDGAPMWHTDGLNVRKESSEPLQPGSKVDIRVRVLGRSITGIAEVTQLDPPHAIRIETPEGSLPTMVEISLTPEEEGTRVTIVTEVRPSGLMKMMASMAGPDMDRLGQESLAKLKTALESTVSVED